MLLDFGIIFSSFAGEEDCEEDCWGTYMRREDRCEILVVVVILDCVANPVDSSREQSMHKATINRRCKLT